MPPSTHRPLIADANFLRLWFAGAFAATARWLEMLAVGIFVFEVTASAALVAAMLMLRMLPMGLFGVFGGEIANRFDRKRILLTTLALMFGVAVAVGSLAYFDRLTVWQVGLAAFIAGLAWVIDFPVRRTLLADAVGSARLGSAMSLDTVASSGTRMIGPLLGGTLYAVAGMDGAFLLSAGAYALAFAILLGLPPIAGHGTVLGGKVAHRIRDGLRVLRRVPVLQGVLAVTVVFNVWGFPIISMVPVIGADVLFLAPFEVGVLASMEGLGSLLGALALAAFARSRQYRLLYFFGVFTYLAAATVFAHSAEPVLSGALLFVLGISMAAFAAMQSALVLLNTPLENRRQMMGILSVCIGSGPIGLAHLGLLASWFGASAACTIVAVEGLAVLAIVAFKWPGLVSRQTDA